MTNIHKENQESKNSFLTRLKLTRQASEDLIIPLSPEDLCLQGMETASPPKWHLAHTTWFFETFVLRPHLPSYRGADKSWGFLFNSYYDACGKRHPRSKRGLLTRPSIKEIMTWRKQVDQALEKLLNETSGSNHSIQNLIELGIQHEQQHQELLLMDLLDGFSRQPLEPSYWSNQNQHIYPTYFKKDHEKYKNQWLSSKGGLLDIGIGIPNNKSNLNEFSFDNESPRHRVWLEPFKISRQLVRNIEYQEFIADGGYERPEFWMSEGWSTKETRGWEAPRYWRMSCNKKSWCWEFTLSGKQPLNPYSPVSHVSWFEADAYARWAKARLPTEQEWEASTIQHGNQINEIHSSLWQWTASNYNPYPGFKPASGAIGEYNAKFMSSQYVLRGSSYLTPPRHSRNTYRNYFSPQSRWMASGIRLAQ